MPDRTNSKHPGLPAWLIWSSTTLLLYILSVGPAYRLNQAGLITVPVLTTIYAPIQKPCLHWGPAYRAYIWYLKLWGVYNVLPPAAVMG